MDKLMLCTQYYKYLHVPAHGLCEEAIAVGRVVTKIPPGVHKGAVTQSGLLQTCANLADLCGVVLHIKKILFGNMLMLLQPPSSPLPPTPFTAPPWLGVTFHISEIFVFFRVFRRCRTAREACEITEDLTRVS